MMFKHHKPDSPGRRPWRDELRARIKTGFGLLLSSAAEHDMEKTNYWNIFLHGYARALFDAQIITENQKNKLDRLRSRIIWKNPRNIPLAEKRVDRALGVRA
jgi:hypothetical protein